MSSRPAKAKTGSKPEVHALSPLNTETLTPSEIKRLNFLGYKQPDIAALSTEEARYRLDNKKPNPGSKAALKAVEKQIGIPNPVSGHFDNTTIETRNAGKDKAAFVIQDEWEGKGLDAKGMLFDELDKPYREANPDYVFRWLHPDVVAKLGTDGFQDVVGPAGKVMCADHWLAFKPRRVQEEQDAKLADEVNAPFRDIGQPKTVNLSGVAGERAFETRESTIHRGDERPRYVEGA